MRLNAIRIVGANHTRSGFLSRVVSPYLQPATPTSSYSASAFSISSLLSLFLPTTSSSSSSSSTSTSPYDNDDQQLPTTETLRNVLAKTRSITDDLARFGIFDEIETGLDSSQDVLAEPNDVDLLLKVKESSRYFLRTATDVGDGEGNAVSLFPLSPWCMRIWLIIGY